MWLGDESKVYSEKVAAGKRGLLRQFVEWLETRNRTSEELLSICLERIATRDPQLQAWVEVSPQPALGGGPLAGIPFGAKDIFETRNLATGYGSALYGRRKGST